MQKWCPEPLTVDPGRGAFVPLSEWHDDAPDAPERGFRPEAGFADVASLLASLSRDEREQVMKLVEVDMRREYEQKHQADEDARKQATAQRLATLEDVNARWRDQFAGEVRREVEDALSTLAARTVEMARLMAEKVVRREVASDPQVLVRALETVLYKIEAGCSLQVTVHPDDAAWLVDHPELRDRLRITEVKDDRRLERGGALVRTRDEEWDVTVERQLSVLTETLEEALSLPPDTADAPEDDHA